MADKLILLRPLFKFQKRKILSCKESLRAMLYNSFSNENMEFQRESLVIRSLGSDEVLVWRVWAVREIMSCFVLVWRAVLSLSSLAGIHLKICPRGVTCCTPDMETKLWTLARETYSQALAASTAHLQATFNAKSRKFDGKLSFVLGLSLVISFTGLGLIIIRLNTLKH